MPYETIREEVTTRVRVCSHCRSRLPSNNSNSNRMLHTCGGMGGSLCTSMCGSMLLGSLLGPVGAIGGAIAGSMAGAFAGQKVTNSWTNFGQKELCRKCENKKNKNGGQLLRRKSSGSVFGQFSGRRSMKSSMW